LYIRKIQIKTSKKMKLLVIIMMLCVTFANAAIRSTDPIHEIKKERKEHRKDATEKTVGSRNFHSLKKWKMTVEYINGDVISKTIKITNIGSFSAMELAFLEAEKHIKTLKKVKDYVVSPVSENSFVLLAGGR